MNEELDRVRADLATMKSVCVEPELPSEEIRIGLVIAVCGLILAAAPWIVPLSWVKIGTVLATLIGLAVYIPFKRRILKRDAVRRRLESRELKISCVVAIALVAYVIWHRFMMTPNPDEWRPEVVGVVFFAGVWLLAISLIHPSRRYYLGAAIIGMVGGLLAQLTTGVTAFVSIMGLTMALSCLTSALWLAWMVRRERFEHVGH